MYYRGMEYRWLNRQAYEPAWKLLQSRAKAVADGRADEIIFACEHEPVYTTGRRGVDNRVSDALPAPVVCSDRGGEMTFHGPGQIMLYPVINLRKRDIGVKRYVSLLEQSCIDLLKQFGVEAGRNCGFPGVWVDGVKIAALGVRISRGVAFHGMALNVEVDPKWFAAIRPCGLSSGVVSLSDYSGPLDLSGLADRWQQCFQSQLGMF